MTDQPRYDSYVSKNLFLDFIKEKMDRKDLNPLVKEAYLSILLPLQKGAWDINVDKMVHDRVMAALNKTTEQTEVQDRQVFSI